MKRSKLKHEFTPFSLSIKLSSKFIYSKKDEDGNVEKVTPITALNFDSLLLTPYGYPKMKPSLKKKIIKGLKQLIYPSNPKTSLFVCDNIPSQVLYAQGKFIYTPHRSMGFYPKISLPYKLHIGNYSFSQQEEMLLYDMFHDDIEGFFYFAKFMASAYMVNIFTKKATVILVNQEYHTEFTEIFMSLLNHQTEFVSYNDCVYTDIQNTNPFIANFNRCAALLVDGLIENNTFSRLRSLVKSNFQETKDVLAGKIRYRNNIPLVLITTDKNYAEFFASHIPSNIISMVNFSGPVTFDMQNFYQLHQALVLCGIKYISNTDNFKQKRVLKEMTDDDITTRFVSLYCSKEDKSYTSKLELRKAFKLFTDTLYPEFGGNSAAVCNLLKEMGHNGSHKKRLKPLTNPVSVLAGVYFNKIRFDSDMEKYTISNIINNTNLCGFEKILAELNSAVLASETN